MALFARDVAVPGDGGLVRRSDDALHDDLLGLDDAEAGGGVDGLDGGLEGDGAAQGDVAEVQFLALRVYQFDCLAAGASLK